MPVATRHRPKIKIMAKNLVACGDVLDYTVPNGETIVSGAPVLVGDVLGVALVGGIEGETIAVQIEGVFELPKKTHATTEALAQGAPVYFDDAEGQKKMTNSDANGANKLVGYAYAAAASTASTVQVLLKSQAKVSVAENVAQITTANGSDAATTQALANATKTSVNAILTALKEAGIMVADA